jgi:hypothetical protein
VGVPISVETIKPLSLRSKICELAQQILVHYIQANYLIIPSPQESSLANRRALKQVLVFESTFTEGQTVQV